MISALFETLGPLFGVLALALLLVLSLLWFVLPFLIYQIRRRMDTLIDETRETRYAIKYLANKLDEATKNKPNP